MAKFKEIETYKNATVLDTVSGLAFEVDYAFEKNGELYYHCGGKDDGFELKDNAEFAVIQKDDIYKNGRLESWLKSGDNDKVVDAIAAKTFSVDKNDTEKFSLAQVYNETYKNANGEVIDLTIGERYGAFKKELGDLSARLKNTYGEKGLGKKDCVEARMLGISRLMQKYDIGRDIINFKNYKELGSYEAAVEKTNNEIHDKQSMSAIAKHELKIDTIKAEMSKYEKSHHIGTGFTQLALGTLFIAFPLINVVLIASGLKNIFFKSYANKMEKDYYKELKSELKSLENQTKAIEIQQKEIQKIENNINKIDKEIDRQEKRLDDVKKELEKPNLSEKEKAKLEDKANKISKDIEKELDKREVQVEKLKALGINAPERLEKPKDEVEQKEENKVDKTSEKDKEKVSDKEKDNTDKKSDETKDDKEKKTDESKDKVSDDNKKSNETNTEEKSETEPKKETEKSNEKELSKDELKAEITDTKEKIAELERYRENKANKLEYTKSDLDKEADPKERVKLERKVDNIKGDVDKADAQLSELKEKLANYESKLNELEKNELNPDANAEKTLEDKNNPKELDAKDAEIEKLKAENDALKQENDYLKAEADDLRNELADLKNEIKDLKEKVDNLEKDKEVKVEQKEDNTESNKEMFDKVNILEKENQDLKSELNSKDDRIAELEAKLNAFENKEQVENSDELNPETFEENEIDTEIPVEINPEPKVNEVLDEKNSPTERQKIDLKIATAEYREEAFGRRISEAAIDSKGNETIVVNNIENGKLAFEIISKDPVEVENGSLKSIEISSSDNARPDKLDTVSSNGIELTFSKDIINNRIGYKEDTVKDMIGKGITSKEDNQLLEIKVYGEDGKVDIYDKDNTDIPVEIKDEIKELIGEDAYDKTAGNFENKIEKNSDDTERLDNAVEHTDAEPETTNNVNEVEESEKTDADNLDEETYDSNEIENDEAKGSDDLPNADEIIIEEPNDNSYDEDTSDQNDNLEDSSNESEDDYDDWGMEDSVE